MADLDLEQHARSRIGQVLNKRYRLDAVLGVGGMAAVYRATHLLVAKEFAVKILHAELGARRDIRTRFVREGCIANTVKHPGVVEVLDHDVTDDGAAFLVMELLEGTTLDAPPAGRLSARATLAIADQLLDALAAAHAKGIVHRDLKPPNLFVTKAGTLKVLDFGIARFKDAASASGPHVTTTGVIGTPAFMAPEQALGQTDAIGPHTDIWAVGATLFTLLSGELVHTGENVSQLLIQAATSPARSLREVSRAPVEVALLVDRALAFKKEDRWPSAVAMRDAARSASEALFGTRVSRSALRKIADPQAPRKTRAPAPAPLPATVDDTKVMVVERAPRRAQRARGVGRSLMGYGLAVALAGAAIAAAVGFSSSPSRAHGAVEPVPAPQLSDAGAASPPVMALARLEDAPAAKTAPPPPSSSPTVTAKPKPRCQACFFNGKCQPLHDHRVNLPCCEPIGDGSDPEVLRCREVSKNTPPQPACQTCFESTDSQGRRCYELPGNMYSSPCCGARLPFCPIDHGD